MQTPDLRGPSTSGEPGPGFDSEFLGIPLPIPELTADAKSRVYTSDKVGGDTPWVIPHTRFSVAMDERRRLPRLSAWNIEGRWPASDPTDRDFTPDPLVDRSAQLPDKFYRADTDFDRGHIARKHDLAWGGGTIARTAQIESCYFSNVAPQIPDFNQTKSGTTWRSLEDAVEQHAKQEMRMAEATAVRLSVFGGPVLLDNDREIQSVQVPRAFWKLIVWNQDNTLMAIGFKLEQDLDVIDEQGKEKAEARQAILDSSYDAFAVFQRHVWELELMSGLRFPSNLVAPKPTQFPEGTVQRLAEAGLESQIVWPSSPGSGE